eukprot:scaffold191750_cov31-Tisochrysis_lutea.AAC.6
MKPRTSSSPEETHAYGWRMRWMYRALEKSWRARCMTLMWCALGGDLSTRMREPACSSKDWYTRHVGQSAPYAASRMRAAVTV